MSIQLHGVCLGDKENSSRGPESEAGKRKRVSQSGCYQQWRGREVESELNSTGKPLRVHVEHTAQRYTSVGWVPMNPGLKHTSEKHSFSGTSVLPCDGQRGLPWEETVFRWSKTGASVRSLVGCRGRDEGIWAGIPGICYHFRSLAQSIWTPIFAPSLSVKWMADRMKASPDPVLLYLVAH